MSFVNTRKYFMRQGYVVLFFLTEMSYEFLSFIVINYVRRM